MYNGRRGCNNTFLDGQAWLGTTRNNTALSNVQLMLTSVSLNGGLQMSALAGFLAAVALDVR
jgi:hypothetical protein